MNREEAIKAVTTVTGPSFREMLKPFRRTVAEISRDLQRQQEQSVFAIHSSKKGTVQTHG
jgi:hypothetical protein